LNEKEGGDGGLVLRFRPSDERGKRGKKTKSTEAAATIRRVREDSGNKRGGRVGKDELAVQVA